MTAALETLSPADLEAAQASFLEHLPRMRAVFAHFLHHKDESTQADLHANAEALAWKTWLRQTEKGEEPAEYATVIARRAVQATFAGRHLHRQQSPKDASSSRAKWLPGFALGGARIDPAGLAERQRS